MNYKHPFYIALLVITFSSTTNSVFADSSLDQALDTQSDEAKTRYQYRHPKETLEFIGIKSGMKVAEVLPGGGWYSKILLPHLGEKGHLVGVDYPQDMWQHFSFADDEFIAKRGKWVTTWPEEAQAWLGDAGGEVSAAKFGSLAKDQNGTFDAVLFIRALHNLARHEDKGNYLSTALNDAFNLLKSGGIVGIVQHQAREDRPNDWANGSNGYLKKSFLLEKMKNAGFEFVGESDINANAEDQANEGDIVWRLPPSLRTSKDNDELKEQMIAIGESNRMTLKFRKP